MSSIVRVKVGNKTYLYESVSYRDSKGMPQNRRKIVGKIDPITGHAIYKSEYIERMAQQGTPLQIDPSQQVFSVDHVRASSIKEFGSFYLLTQAARKIGMVASLQEAVSKYWEDILRLACYLVCTGDPFLYCEIWVSNTECGPVGSMSSQRISDLLAAITSQERESFYGSWCNLRSEQEYLALDITSISSYSTLIDDVEWGYNRDNEELPQINLCMLLGEQSKLPIYQTLYSGSLKDVSTLDTTTAKLTVVSKGKPLLLVMDKGFFSAKNVNGLLADETYHFIIAVPFTSNFAKSQVTSESKDIDCIENTILVGTDSIRAVTKVRSWNKDHKLWTHVYFNALKATKTREELYAHVAWLKEQAQADPVSAMQDADCSKYLLIRHSAKAALGYTINIKTDVVDHQLRNAGWMVLISNQVSDAKEALSIYRNKDVVEKGFLRLKNSLDLGRLRVHSDTRMQNKAFVGFLALILLAHIHKVMTDRCMYQRMTIKTLLLTLSKLRVQEINGTRILFPLTKEQKEIYKAFDVDVPE